MDFQPLHNFTSEDILYSVSQSKDIPLPVLSASDGIKTGISLNTDISEPSVYDMELYVKGGLLFKVKDRTFVLKIGFEKGQYDSLVQGYKPRCLLLLTDLTGFLSGDSDLISAIPLHIVENNHSSSDEVWMSEYKRMKLKRISQEMHISVVDKKTGNEEPVTIITLPELAQAWARNAENFSMPYNGRKIYAVPQWLPDVVFGEPFGYVLSEETPLSPNTGLPLDFVTLSRWDGSAVKNRVYKPVGYSIPLCMALEKLPQGGWELREMESSELTDALDQENEETERAVR